MDTLETFVKTVGEELLPKMITRIKELQAKCEEHDRKFASMKQIFTNFNDKLSDFDTALGLANLSMVRGQVDIVQNEVNELRDRLILLEMMVPQTPTAPVAPNVEPPAVEEKAEEPKPKRGGRRKSTRGTVVAPREVDMDTVKRLEDMQPNIYPGPAWDTAPVIAGVKIDGGVIHAVKIAVAEGRSTAYMISQGTGLPEEVAQFVMDQSEATLELIATKHPMQV